jgi:hypothetical protein
MQTAERERATKANYYVSLDVLTELLAKVKSGRATPQEREYATRTLSMFRSRYVAGNLSKRAALQLGLIDAKGNALN